MVRVGDRDKSFEGRVEAISILARQKKYLSGYVLIYQYMDPCNLYPYGGVGLKPGGRYISVFYICSEIRRNVLAHLVTMH